MFKVFICVYIWDVHIGAAMKEFINSNESRIHCSSYVHICAYFDSFIVHIQRYAPQEASWWWVFDPIYTLLFDLYHQLRTTVLSDVYHYWVSRGRYLLVSSGRVRRPLDSKKLFVWCVRAAINEFINSNESLIDLRLLYIYLWIFWFIECRYSRYIYRSRNWWMRLLFFFFFRSSRSVYRSCY